MSVCQVIFCPTHFEILADILNDTLAVNRFFLKSQISLSALASNKGRVFKNELVCVHKPPPKSRERDCWVQDNMGAEKVGF